HPWVDTAVVLAHDDQEGGRRLTAYVVPASIDDTFRPDVSTSENTLMSNWQSVYEDLYAEPTTAQDDFVGWRSSVTGRPIPTPPKRDWRSSPRARTAGRTVTHTFL